MYKLEPRCRNAPWEDTIQVLIVAIDETGNKHVAQPVTMVQQEKVVASYPTVSLAREEAQFLMDELWHCGLRPSEGTGSAGALAATQYHLEDMRRIVLSRCNDKE